MDLPEDLVFKIICYLPLKLAIQCKCLNKGFKKLVSDPKFAQQHAPLSTDQEVLFSAFARVLETNPALPRVFGDIRGDDVVDDHYLDRLLTEAYYKISLNPLGVKNGHPSNVDWNHPSSYGIVMSSPNSGRILIQFFNGRYCVFNPVTGAYFVLPQIPSQNTFKVSTGLVDEVSSPQYKVVAISRRNFTLKRLEVAIFESEHNCWRQRTYETRDIGLRKLNPFDYKNSCQPVYMQGCLHFAEADCTILVFDVKTELLRIINKPDGVKYRKYRNHYYMWFGEVGGSLVLVLAYAKRIVICVHDKAGKKWRSKTIIQDIRTVIHDVWVVFPIYYDGDDSLMFMTDVLDIYLYKVREHIAQRIGNLGIPQYDLFPNFHPFVPTLADIPCCRYLKPGEEIKLLGGEEEEWMEKDKERLLNLQSLLLGYPPKVSVDI